MKNNPINRLFKIFFIFPLLLLAVTQSSVLFLHAQPGQKSDNTALKLSEFVPPVLSYSSVFDQYQGYQEEEVLSWPEVNSTVGRIGGWRFYLEEEAQTDQPDPKSVNSQQPQTFSPGEATDKHTGHEGKP